MNGYLRFLQESPAPEAIIHPVDAKKLSLEGGDAVRICTDHGEMQAVVQLDKDMSLGAISVPHGWPGPSSVNNLLSCDLNVDPLTGMPLLSGVPVTIAKRPAQ
jgi:anaerobic selenocysteine-containing dehydrogenase